VTVWEAPSTRESRGLAASSTIGKWRERITALWQNLSLAEREAACRPGDCGFLKYHHAQPEKLEPCGVWEACVKGVG
jgi:hypothetical protein